jgi:hypothetical protein
MRLRQSRIAAALTTVLIGLVFQPLTTALAASVQATEEDFAAMAPAQSLAEIVPPAGRLRLTATLPAGNVVHMLPTVKAAAGLVNNADNGPLVYHSGGSIMPSVTIYSIFWLPSKLQNGGSTGMASNYISTMIGLSGNYPAHGIQNNSTQYYQVIGTTKTYIKSQGGAGGNYTDTSAYPTSGCTDSYTPGNCLTDAQIQAEVKKVLSLKGWTGGLSKIYMVYTSSGEGSCFDSSGSSCAYTEYCAYHSAISGTTPIIYGNMAYADLNVCYAGQPTPHGDGGYADAEASIATHEITEANTDPLLNAWYTAQGNEIGDICAYNYGTATWDSAKANEMWNGAYFEVQMEWDNHFGGCVQIGP